MKNEPPPETREQLIAHWRQWLQALPVDRRSSAVDILTERLNLSDEERAILLGY